MDAHREALQLGGVEGFRDENLLRSAIATPFVGYYSEIQDKAAALLRGIACNHGFIDGNKRTAALITEFFVRKNGYKLNAADKEFESLILALVVHKIVLEDVTSWIASKLVRIKP